jgi:hypothetical protein
MAHWQLGHADQALRDFRRVIELEPTNFEAHRGAGGCRESLCAGAIRSLFPGGTPREQALTGAIPPSALPPPP